jgi:hypothetical protein
MSGMPGFFTDYVNNKFLDLVLGNSAFAPPSALYVGLSLNASNKSGNVVEPTSGGYARVALSNDLSTFPTAVGGTKSNATTVGFAAPTGNWGTVLSVFVADAPTGGNVLAMADLAAAKSIVVGTPAPTIAVGALYFSHT